LFWFCRGGGCWRRIVSRTTSKAPTSTWFGSRTSLTRWPHAHCGASQVSGLRIVASFTRPQRWCLIWLWRCTVQTECRGSLGTSSLFRGLNPMRLMLMTCISKYQHFNYMSYNIFITLLICFLLDSTNEDSQTIPRGWYRWHRGCHLVPSWPDGVLYLWWSRPCTCIRVRFMELDPDLHLRTMQDTFPHHDVEGIVGPVSYIAI
jgi:hypothetical protein